MDLNAMDIGELKKLKKNVDKAVATYESRRLQDARQMLEAQAKELGYSLGDLLGKKTNKVVNFPKYRDPENHDLTWTGKGRRPKWIIEALERGVDIETMAV